MTHLGSPPWTRCRTGQLRAALGLPDTRWHNDLHTNNVFDSPTGLVFFDLGDALVGSPLCDLLIPLRFLAHAGGGDFDAGDDPFVDPGLSRVVEAAIEPWADLAPPAELRRAVPAAAGGAGGAAHPVSCGAAAVARSGRVE